MNLSPLRDRRRRRSCSSREENVHYGVYLPKSERRCWYTGGRNVKKAIEDEKNKSYEEDGLITLTINPRCLCRVIWLLEEDEREAMIREDLFETLTFQTIFRFQVLIDFVADLKEHIGSENTLDCKDQFISWHQHPCRCTLVPLNRRENSTLLLLLRVFSCLITRAKSCSSWIRRTRPSTYRSKGPCVRLVRVTVSTSPLNGVRQRFTPSHGAAWAPWPCPWPLATAAVCPWAAFAPTFAAIDAKSGVAEVALLSPAAVIDPPGWRPFGWGARK